jgi:hypothetical protein
MLPVDGATTRLRPSFVNSFQNFCIEMSENLERLALASIPWRCGTTFEHFFRRGCIPSCRRSRYLTIWRQKMWKNRKNFGTNWPKPGYTAHSCLRSICSAIWRSERYLLLLRCISRRQVSAIFVTKWFANFEILTYPTGKCPFLASISQYVKPKTFLFILLYGGPCICIWGSLGPLSAFLPSDLNYSPHFKWYCEIPLSLIFHRIIAYWPTKQFL